MNISEKELLLPVLKDFGISPVQWLADMAMSRADLASRLYIFNREMNVCVTFCCCGNSRVEVQELTVSGTEVKAWLQKYLGVFAVDSDRASVLCHRLTELAEKTGSNCTTNSRGGILAYHAVFSNREEHCVMMVNPQLHANESYKQIVNLYSNEFLGGNIQL